MKNPRDCSPGSSEKSEAERPGRRRFRWLWIALSLLILGAVGFVLSVSEDSIDVTETGAPPPLPLVSVETIRAEPQTAEIAVFGEIRPRWSAELRATVSGQVIKIEPAALAGEVVEAGALLIEIESSRYDAELAAAEQALKETELALWHAKNANIIAQSQFTRTKTKPPNALALKLPQLDIARGAVETANARVLAARQQVNATKITAPFSAFVTKRFVSLGQTINIGDPLVKLADNRSFEVEVGLSRKDWRLLQKPLAGGTAKILDQDGVLIANANIRSGGGFLDAATRQHKVFVEIENTAARPVLSGDFVQVLLPGVTVPSALNIPASARTQEGYVWFVGADDRLRRAAPDVLFQRHDRMIVSAIGEETNWRIAITPLASFLPGQKVLAKAVQADQASVKTAGK